MFWGAAGRGEDATSLLAAASYNSASAEGAVPSGKSATATRDYRSQGESEREMGGMGADAETPSTRAAAAIDADSLQPPEVPLVRA